MTHDWIHSANRLHNPFLDEWKSAGKKIVGYTCSYLPDEIFHAAGILPYRLRGHEAQECSIGDTYFGPFICSMPKHFLQLAGEGRLSFLDGAIITPGCDSMRRLDECWRKAGDDIDGIVPRFFFHFGVPHKFSDYTLKWFSDEIHRLIDALQTHFGVTLTDDKLLKSIELYNRGRELLRQFDELRLSPDAPIDGATALAVVLAASTMPREAYNERLAALLKEFENRKETKDGRIRLMLVGSANDDVELVRLVEGESARVVADNLCFGPRSQLQAVDVSDDPVQTLASHYLAKNECPRMYGQYENRLELLREKIRRGAVEGVVLQNIRFCDIHGAENGLFDRDLEAEGIPCLRIEREYGPLVEKGRLKIRLDAFLEKIAKHREGRS